MNGYAGGGTLTYNGQTLTLQEALELAHNDPHAYREFSSVIPGFQQVYDAWLNAQTALENQDYNGIYAAVGSSPVDIAPETEKWLDNTIARQNTEQAQQHEEHMRDTNVTSTAQQLQSVGLAAGTVAQTGFTSANGVAAANNAMTNNAQQRAINRYNQRMGLAKSVIAMAGQMASSGIYGSALGAAKHAGSAIASSAAHSALNVLQNSKHPNALLQQLAMDGNNYQLNNLFGK